jgi:hypothetical protein
MTDVFCTVVHDFQKLGMQVLLQCAANVLLHSHGSTLLKGLTLTRA